VTTDTTVKNTLQPA